MTDIWPMFGSSENRGRENLGRARFFGLGEVRLVILSLLGEAPKHGYQLMKDLGERLGDLYRSSAGTVYPTLKQLEKEGLIESRLKEGRNIYRLAKEGRRVVLREAQSIDEIWSRAAGFQELGKQLGPHTVVVASPLQEVIAAGLLAANWSSGNPNREDQVRSILRDAASHLRRLAKDHKWPAKERA